MVIRRTRTKGGRRRKNRRGRTRKHRGRKHRGRKRRHSRKARGHSLRKTKSAPRILMRHRFRKKHRSPLRVNASWMFRDPITGKSDAPRSLAEAQKQIRHEMRRKNKAYEEARRRDMQELEEYYKQVGRRWDAKTQKWLNV